MLWLLLAPLAYYALLYVGSPLGVTKPATPVGSRSFVVHDPISNLNFLVRDTSLTLREVLDMRNLKAPAVLTFSEQNGVKRLIKVLNNDTGNSLVVAARNAVGI